MVDWGAVVLPVWFVVGVMVWMRKNQMMPRAAISVMMVDA